MKCWGQYVFSPAHHLSYCTHKHPHPPTKRTHVRFVGVHYDLKWHTYILTQPITSTCCCTFPWPYHSILPPQTHYSLTTYLPQLSSPPPNPQFSVDVKVGVVVSNSPSDTGLLTFHCTLRIEGFLWILTSVTFHWPWWPLVHSGVLQPDPGLGRTHDVECQDWPPPLHPRCLRGWQQTDLLFVAWNISEENGRWHHNHTSPTPEVSLCTLPPLLWAAHIQIHIHEAYIISFIPYENKLASSCHQLLS